MHTICNHWKNIEKIFINPRKRKELRQKVHQICELSSYIWGSCFEAWQHKTPLQRKGWASKRYVSVWLTNKTWLISMQNRDYCIIHSKHRNSTYAHKQKERKTTKTPLKEEEEKQYYKYKLKEQSWSQALRHHYTNKSYVK